MAFLKGKLHQSLEALCPVCPACCVLLVGPPELVFGFREVGVRVLLKVWRVKKLWETYWDPSPLPAAPLAALPAPATSPTPFSSPFPGVLANTVKGKFRLSVQARPLPAPWMLVNIFSGHSGGRAGRGGREELTPLASAPLG